MMDSAQTMAVVESTTAADITDPQEKGEEWRHPNREI